ncbi:MAG: flagellar basal body rod protein FlgC [Candidatus Sericytochromatia bacterium]|nr:flagellar basal body rod protein FlgC [Candidatus Sericytochromatia bacterium]
MSTLSQVLDISASAMTANRFWLERISNNLANANTTQGPNGEAYRREIPIFAEILRQEVGGTQLPMGVEATGVAKDPSPFPRVYNPGHPHADAQGFVSMPNVNVVTEMVDMITASRTYEANISVSSAAKNMMSKAIEIGK